MGRPGKTNSAPEIRLGTGTQYIAMERAEGPELSLKEEPGLWTRVEAVDMLGGIRDF